jgi:hypothetical protein
MQYMPKIPAHETDNSEPAGEDVTPLEGSWVTVENDGANLTYFATDPVARLLLSGIVTIVDSVLTWRAGHLEHIANLFAGDPETTERNYAEDLAVARAYSANVWERLIAKE